MMKLLQVGLPVTLDLASFVNYTLFVFRYIRYTAAANRRTIQAVVLCGAEYALQSGAECVCSCNASALPQL